MALAPNHQTALCQKHHFRPFEVETGLEVDQCTNCKFWIFDRGELAKTLSFDPIPQSHHEHSTKEHCPRCEHPLEIRSLTSKGKSPPHFFNCPSCGTQMLDSNTLHLLRAVAETPVETSSGRTRRLARQRPATRFGDHPLGVPFLVLLGLLGSQAGPLPAFLSLGFHECGHAVAAWLCATPAFPVVIAGFTWHAEQASTLFGAVVWFLLVLGSAWLLQERCTTFAGMALTALAVSLFLTFGTGVDAHREIVILGGTLGEIILPALILAGFWARAPSSMRWDFWRYPVALLAVTALFESSFRFSSISKGANPLPMGSALGGLTKDGDLSKLVSQYSWTQEFFLLGFESLSWLGFGVIAALVFSSLLTLKRSGLRSLRAH